MTEQRITLVRVDHNVQVGYRNGGSYSATVVHYLNSNGESKDKGVASSFLEGAEQLAQQLQAAVPNQAYILITEKSACGKYSNLIGLTPDDGRRLQDVPAAQKAQYQGGAAKGKSSSFDNVGAQIGNALTNAAAISPEGTTLADLGKTAEGIIRLGEILKQRHLAGAYAPKPPAAPAPVQQVAPPAVQPPAAAPQAQVVVDGGTAFSDLIG